MDRCTGVRGAVRFFTKPATDGAISKEKSANTRK
jgi:hypothetical protein